MSDPLTAAKAILDGSARGDDCRVVAEAYLEAMHTLAGDPPLLRALSDLRAMRETLTLAQAAAKRWRDEALALRAAVEASRNGEAPILLCVDRRTPWQPSDASGSGAPQDSAEDPKEAQRVNGGLGEGLGGHAAAPSLAADASEVETAPSRLEDPKVAHIESSCQQSRSKMQHEATAEVANGAPVVRVGQVWAAGSRVMGPVLDIVDGYAEFAGGRHMAVDDDGRPVFDAWRLVRDVPAQGDHETRASGVNDEQVRRDGVITNHPSLTGHPAYEAFRRAPFDAEPASDDERAAADEARSGAFTKSPPTSILDLAKAEGWPRRRIE